MQRIMLTAKIHRATVTEANLDYDGSLTVDQDLLDAATILPYQHVLVSNVNNGERFETYVIPGPRGSGVICLNGPTARKGVVGDKLIIFCYNSYEESELKGKGWMPRIITVDEKNRRERNT